VYKVKTDVLHVIRYAECEPTSPNNMTETAMVSAGLRDPATETVTNANRENVIQLGPIQPRTIDFPGRFKKFALSVVVVHEVCLAGVLHVKGCCSLFLLPVLWLTR